MIKQKIINLYGIKYKQISFHKKYWINEYGDVYSVTSGKYLKPALDVDGYYRIDLYKNGKQKHFHVHKLVAMMFISDSPNGKQVNHKDDNKRNNHVSNLYFGTQKENIKDMYRNNHRVGSIRYITVKNKETNEIRTFCPARNFLTYAGRRASNGGVKRAIERDWFKEKYELISYERIKNRKMLESVTTTGDEFSQAERRCCRSERTAGEAQKR